MEALRPQTSLTPLRPFRTWLPALAMTAVVAAGGAAAALLGGHGGLPLVFAVVALLGLVLPYALDVLTPFADDAGGWLKQKPARIWLVPAGVLAIYLVYAAGTASFSAWALLRLALFVLLPTALVYPARNAERVTWNDALAVACIWLPFDMGWLAEIWSWPAGEGAYILNTAVAIDLAIALFVGLRRFTGVNIRFTASLGELQLAAFALVMFMTFAIPFGLSTEFIVWNPKVMPLAQRLGTPLGIFFFIALPEELLFRGLVQNFLQKLLVDKPGRALLFAATFFGATHLNNDPVMDWRYFLLATVAGIFYGWTYQKTRSLLLPALVHASVDSLWVFFFLR